MFSEPPTRDFTSPASAATPASVPTSPAKPSQRPGAPSPFSSAAAASQASPLRDAMRTRAPACTSASAHMRPMPVAPPVTSAVLPAAENNDDR